MRQRMSGTCPECGTAMYQPEENEFSPPFPHELHMETDGYRCPEWAEKRPRVVKTPEQWRAEIAAERAAMEAIREKYGIPR